MKVCGKVQSAALTDTAAIVEQCRDVAQAPTGKYRRRMQKWNVAALCSKHQKRHFSKRTNSISDFWIFSASSSFHHSLC